ELLRERGTGVARYLQPRRTSARRARGGRGLRTGRTGAAGPRGGGWSVFYPGGPRVVNVLHPGGREDGGARRRRRLGTLCESQATAATPTPRGNSTAPRAPNRDDVNRTAGRSRAGAPPIRHRIGPRDQCRTAMAFGPRFCVPAPENSANG